MKSIKNRSLSFAPETEKETFGEFVLQTNEVQAVLALTVSLYSLYKGKMDIDFLFKKTTLGRLISKFQVCIIKETKENSEMNKLLFILKDYNRYRCVIAHEMHLPDKRLNQKEAKKAIKIGENILKILDGLIEKHKLYKHFLCHKNSAKINM